MKGKCMEKSTFKKKRRRILVITNVGHGEPCKTIECQCKFKS